jgi:hypothetical protein
MDDADVMGCEVSQLQRSAWAGRGERKRLHLLGDRYNRWLVVTSVPNERESDVKIQLKMMCVAEVTDDCRCRSVGLG